MHKAHINIQNKEQNALSSSFSNKSGFFSFTSFFPTSFKYYLQASDFSFPSLYEKKNIYQVLRTFFFVYIVVEYSHWPHVVFYYVASNSAFSALVWFRIACLLFFFLYHSRVFFIDHSDLFLSSGFQYYLFSALLLFSWLNLPKCWRKGTTSNLTIALFL